MSGIVIIRASQKRELMTFKASHDIMLTSSMIINLTPSIFLPIVVFVSRVALVFFDERDILQTDCQVNPPILFDATPVGPRATTAPYRPLVLPKKSSILHNELYNF